MRKGGAFDGWARLSANVLQQAFAEISDLYEAQRQPWIREKEFKAISTEIETVKEFLTDGENPYVTYLVAKGHVLDIDKIKAIIKSYEGGNKCVKVMGRDKVYYS